MKRRGLLGNKRGAFTKFTKYFSLPVLIVVFIFFVFFYFGWTSCEFAKSDLAKSMGYENAYAQMQQRLAPPQTQEGQNILARYIGPDALKYYFFLTSYKVGGILGFDSGYEELQKYGGCLGAGIHNIKATASFIWRLFIGALAGFWIFLIGQMSMWLRNMWGKGGYVSRWQTLVAGNLWKIIAIGMGYAILMQIPIVNKIIQIITLELLGLNMFLVSFVIAFEIGLGPGWVEDFIKFRLRIKAERAIIAAQAMRKLERGSLGAS